jgi:SAM-dependent methyltransferase
MDRKLTPKDQEIIQQFYDRLLSKEKDEARQVGWRDMETQNLRFRILAEIGQLANHSVLDVGCGLCAFYEYLVRPGIKCDYTGYEIQDSMFKIAQKRFPQLPIFQRDFLTDTDEKTYDYVIMAGILSLKLTENERYIRSMFETALRRCKIGIAANMMSTYVDYHDDYLYYADPCEIFKLAKELTPRVALRHDYMPYEFIIYLYKDDFPGQLY